MILGIDVSKWQPTVDWAMMKDKGVEFAVVKATQGNYLTDPKLRNHLDGALKAGMVVGVFHWCDPTIQAESQAFYFLKATENMGYHFAALDVEQQWSNWQQWRDGNITQVLSPDKISNCARGILNFWEGKIKKPLVVYTRASFISEYAKPATTWLSKYSLWLAHYPYKKGRVSTDWETFKQNYLPSIPAPSLPPNCKDWEFWQFTGEKFVLPGATSSLDINYFNGSVDDLKKWAGTKAVPPAPALTLEQRIDRLEQLARANGWSV